MNREKLPLDILPPATDVPDKEAIARWWVVTTAGQEPSIALAFWTTTGGPMQGMGYVKDCTPGCKFHPGRWRSQTNTPCTEQMGEHVGCDSCAKLDCICSTQTRTRKRVYAKRVRYVRVPATGGTRVDKRSPSFHHCHLCCESSQHDLSPVQSSRCNTLQTKR